MSKEKWKKDKKKNTKKERMIKTEEWKKWAREREREKKNS